MTRISMRHCHVPMMLKHLVHQRQKYTPIDIHTGPNLYMMVWTRIHPMNTLDVVSSYCGPCQTKGKFFVELPATLHPHEGPMSLRCQEVFLAAVWYLHVAIDWQGYPCPLIAICDVAVTGNMMIRTRVLREVKQREEDFSLSFSQGRTCEGGRKKD